MRSVRAAVIPAAVAMVAVSVAAPAQASDGPRAHLDHRASAIYLQDDSPTGEGPFVPAVTVTGRVDRCPVGLYWLTADLVQDGVTYAQSSGGGLGGNELVCQTLDGSPTAATSALSVFFSGDGLRPGKARIHLTVSSPYTGEELVKTTRRVRIPKVDPVAVAPVDPVDPVDPATDR